MTSGYLSDQHAVRILDSGGVLLMATDTLPGLHARADKPAAIRRLTGIKGRAGGKPLLVLAASPALAAAVTGDLEPRQRAYATRCWPGPFSLILPAAADLDPCVTAGGRTVAVRVPDRPTLVTLLATVGFPLVSTSANRAGEEPAPTLAIAAERLADEVDGVWSPGDEVRAMVREPSALIDLTVWPPRVLRPGPLPPPALGADGLDLVCGGS